MIKKYNPIPPSPPKEHIFVVHLTVHKLEYNLQIIFLQPMLVYVSQNSKIQLK